MELESFKIDHLSKILKEFCTENKLPYLSADDLLHDKTIIKTQQQTMWLFHYCQWWDECINNPHDIWGNRKKNIMSSQNV